MSVCVFSFLKLMKLTSANGSSAQVHLRLHHPTVHTFLFWVRLNVTFVSWKENSNRAVKCFTNCHPLKGYYNQKLTAVVCVCV